MSKMRPLWLDTLFFIKLYAIHLFKIIRIIIISNLGLFMLLSVAQPQQAGDVVARGVRHCAGALVILAERGTRVGQYGTRTREGQYAPRAGGITRGVKGEAIAARHEFAVALAALAGAVEG